jgi:hypothetical protein
VLGFVARAFGVGYFYHPDQTSIEAAIVAFGVLTLATISRLSIKGDSIVYESVFHTDRIPLESVRRATGRRIWTVLPLPRQFVTLELDKTTGMNAFIIRLGVCSWPSAKIWAHSANDLVSKHN